MSAVENVFDSELSVGNVMAGPHSMDSMDRNFIVCIKKRPTIIFLFFLELSRQSQLYFASQVGLK